MRNQRNNEMEIGSCKGTEKHNAQKNDILISIITRFDIWPDGSGLATVTVLLLVPDLHRKFRHEMNLCQWGPGV
jgi:hypothetical protein